MSSPTEVRWFLTSRLLPVPGVPLNDRRPLQSRLMFPSLRDRIEVIGPVLHHLAPLLQELGAVIGAGDLVSGGVRQLPVHHLVAVTQPLLDGAHRQGAKAVACHAALVSHALQHGQDGVVANGLLGVTLVGEQVLAPAGQGMQFAQQGQRLA